MASNSTISITLKLDGDTGTFQSIIKDANGLKAAMQGTMAQADQLKGRLINFAALSTGVEAMQRGFANLQGRLQGLTDAYAVQETAEAKLEAVMRNTMIASDSEIQSIKELCAAQQELGVIGDEVQLAGAQEMATYLTQKSTLETLIPVMNDMVAQQYGLGASGENAAQIATMLGKVMNGQVNALSRYGYSFTEAQEKVLKFGTEEERAAMLAAVVGESVGGMNAALAQTDSGRQQQLANALGDLKEQAGAIARVAMPYVTWAAEAGKAFGSITTLVAGIKALTVSVYQSIKGFTLSTVEFIKNRGAIIAHNVAAGVAKASTVAWTAVQTVFNAVLSANPIGLIVMGIGALITAVITAYNKVDWFRQGCDRLWGAIKPLVKVIVDGLGRALSWIADRFQEVWEWLKKILGLAGDGVDVKVNVRENSVPDTSALEEKYKNYTDKAPKTSKVSAPKAAKPSAVWSETASTLGAIEDNISILQERLKAASVDEAAGINQQIALWQAKADAIRKAGTEVEEQSDTYTSIMIRELGCLDDYDKAISDLRTLRGKASKEMVAQIDEGIAVLEQERKEYEGVKDAVDSTGPVYRKEAKNLAEIGENIRYLRTEMQTATPERIALINREIEYWEAEESALKGLGKTAEKTGESIDRSMRNAWGGVKGIKSGFDEMRESLEGTGTAWGRMTGFVDGFLGVVESLRGVIETIQELTAATRASSAASLTDAGAKRVAAAAATGAVGPTTSLTSAEGTSAAAAGTDATMQLTDASAKALNAHSWIPWVGVAMGVAAVAAMIATMAKVPKFAEGGLAYGPTLGVFGEYAGASHNPEVVAPLDKLRDLIGADDRGGTPKVVDVRITGRDLIATIDLNEKWERRVRP